MSRKIYIFIMAVVLLAGIGAAAFGIQKSAGQQSSFWGDGYVLDTESGENGAIVPKPIYFTAGTRYKEVYPDHIRFKDMYGQSQEVSRHSFIHYADESISTFHQGVVLKLNELSSGLLNYYSLGSDSIMNRNGEGYLLDDQGMPLEFKDYIWKLEENKYLAASPSMKLILPDGTEETCSGFLELEYIDNGIVRLTGKEQAIQVLAMGSSLTLSDGTCINFETRSIEKDGQINLYLTEMLLEEGAGANIPVTPDKDRVLKVPTFDIRPLTARTVSRARTARSVRQERAAKPERTEMKARKATRERKVQKATRVTREAQEATAHPVRQEKPVLQAPPVEAEALRQQSLLCLCMC